MDGSYGAEGTKQQLGGLTMPSSPDRREDGLRSALDELGMQIERLEKTLEVHTNTVQGFLKSDQTAEKEGGYGTDPINRAPLVSEIIERVAQIRRITNNLSSVTERVHL